MPPVAPQSPDAALRYQISGHLRRSGSFEDLEEHEQVCITALDKSLVPFDGTPPAALPTKGWLERWTKVGTLDKDDIEEVAHLQYGVVDTNCLLNDVACLHLLADRMTLIIPRAVVSEIDGIMHRTATNEQEQGKHFQARVSRNWMHAELKSRKHGRIKLQSLGEQAFPAKSADQQILSCAKYFQRHAADNMGECHRSISFCRSRLGQQIETPPVRCVLLTRDKILAAKAIQEDLIASSANEAAWNLYAAGRLCPQ